MSLASSPSSVEATLESSSSDAPSGGESAGVPGGCEDGASGGGEGEGDGAEVCRWGVLPVEVTPTLRRPLEGLAFCSCSFFRSAAARVRSWGRGGMRCS